MTKIEWADEVINLVTGCTPCSTGCDNCYAKTMHRRLRGMGSKKYLQPFSEVRCWPDELNKIAKVPAGKRVFINSMGDLFHKDVPERFIANILAAMATRPDVTFMLLTKRAKRLGEIARLVEIPRNVWCGVTVCNQSEVDDKLPLLLQVSATVRFLSIEPMLAKITLPAQHADWVIVGGETGPGARPLDLEWAISIRWHCEMANIPFFFKKVGGKRETPESLQVRELPSK